MDTKAPTTTTSIGPVLKQRAIDLKKALEKYDPRDSEGEELELAQFYYAIYVPEKDQKINSDFYTKKAELHLGDKLKEVHTFVKESGHQEAIFDYFLSALEFAKALYKDRFPNDDQILHRVDAYQNLTASYDKLSAELEL